MPKRLWAPSRLFVIYFLINTGRLWLCKPICGTTQNSSQLFHSKDNSKLMYAIHPGLSGSPLNIEHMSQMRRKCLECIFHSDLSWLFVFHKIWCIFLIIWWNPSHSNFSLGRKIGSLPDFILLCQSKCEKKKKGCYISLLFWVVSDIGLLQNQTGMQC